MNDQPSKGANLMIRPFLFTKGVIFRKEIIYEKSILYQKGFTPVPTAV